MKKAPFVLVVLLTSISYCSCKNNNGQTEIQFDKDTVNFSISHGKPFKAIFKVNNIGNEDLNILNVSGDCSCTNIEYPKEAIPAGISAEIKVTYNSDGDEGEVKKIIVVKSNTDPILHTLTLKGMVTKITGF
ncbi:DUF1573 domain-containing protein [Larkinella sp. VNQ87]|uniref:DUF1573 domain-containing protein n=1 Tax=Larkinella sp. VNQ87 TaxID=3400921 RepID=UPI003BFF31B4